MNNEFSWGSAAYPTNSPFEPGSELAAELEAAKAKLRAANDRALARRVSPPRIFARFRLQRGKGANNEALWKSITDHMVRYHVTCQKLRQGCFSMTPPPHLTDDLLVLIVEKCPVSVELDSSSSIKDRSTKTDNIAPPMKDDADA